KKRDYKLETAQDAVDSRYVQGECDAVICDVNKVLVEQFDLRGRGTEENEVTDTYSVLICGATIDESQKNIGLVAINYNGENCQGYSRTGRVTVTVDQFPIKKWKQKTCVLQIKLVGYKIT